jgi:hypothetical protein
MKSKEYPIPTALYAILRVMINPNIPWKYSGDIQYVNGAPKGHIFKK